MKIQKPGMLCFIFVFLLLGNAFCFPEEEGTKKETRGDVLSVSQKLCVPTSEDFVYSIRKSLPARYWRGYNCAFSPDLHHFLFVSDASNKFWYYNLCTSTLFMSFDTPCEQVVWSNGVFQIYANVEQALTSVDFDPKDCQLKNRKILCKNVIEYQVSDGVVFALVYSPESKEYEISNGLIGSAEMKTIARFGKHLVPTKTSMLYVDGNFAFVSLLYPKENQDLFSDGSGITANAKILCLSLSNGKTVWEKEHFCSGRILDGWKINLKGDSKLFIIGYDYQAGMAYPDNLILLDRKTGDAHLGFYTTRYLGDGRYGVSKNSSCLEYICDDVIDKNLPGKLPRIFDSTTRKFGRELQRTYNLQFLSEKNSILLSSDSKGFYVSVCRRDSMEEVELITCDDYFEKSLFFVRDQGVIIGEKDGKLVGYRLVLHD